MITPSKQEKIMAERSAGRPSIYGFHELEMGGIMKFKDSQVKMERIRRAALEYARRAGKVFSTRRLDDKLLIKRIE